MWNKSISLPAKKTPEINGNGILIGTGYEYMGGIPASYKDTTREDEMLASQEGYTADLVVEIMACNYSGQSFLVDEETGEAYDIKRSFRGDKAQTVILTCERRERGKT